MAWNKVSNADQDWLRAIEAMVSDTVTYFRNRGHKRDIAIEQASLALGISQRKTKSIFYQEPVAASQEDRDRVFQAFMSHLDQQAEDYARRAEAVKAKRRQMELGI